MLRKGRSRRGILIVDDDVEILQGLVAGLSGHGLDLRPSLGSRQALEALEQEIPQMVVSKLRGESLDGFEICRRVKSNPSSRDVPVILTGSSIDPLERIQALRAGASDVLQQPFLVEELLWRILRLMTDPTRSSSVSASSLDRTPPKSLPSDPNSWMSDCPSGWSQPDDSLRGMLHELEVFNKTLLDTTKGLIVVLDLEGKIVQFNHAMESATGWSEEEVIGTPFMDCFIPADQREQVRRVFNDLRGFLASSHHENECIRRDGTSLWIAWANSVIYDDAGQPKFIVGTGLDRSEQKRFEREIVELNANLERRVVERTRDLQLANQELESFSYSVSHDLRAPLRTIDGYAKALEEDFQEQLPPEARSHLQRIRIASGNMGRLIDDLLELSRSLRTPLHRSWVNLSEIANEIVDSLRTIDSHREVAVDIQPSLISWSDPVLTRVLIQNLLDNAWKYTSTTKEPSIRFHSVRMEESDWFAVEDNGVGFDMEYAPRLFQTFQRLHSGSQFPGSGVGLATVKRIVQRHGGAIFGQGFPQRGAIFRFNLGGQGFNPS